MLPDQTDAPANPHLMVSAGKQGTLYLVNRDDMGGFNPTDQVVQELPKAVGGLWSTPAYWRGRVKSRLQNMIYTIGVSDQPKMFVVSKGLIQTPPASIAGAFTFGYPGASPVISANGTTGGILWAIDSSAWSTGGPAILYAFDAANLNTELYDSNQFSSDDPGPAVKFTVPTVANGSVYMGTQTQLAVFGLLPSTSANLTITPDSIAFGDKVTTGTTSKPKRVTIKNTSSKKTGAAVDIEMESASPSVFAVKSECKKTLKPGKSCKASVTFKPTNTTPQTGSLMIYDNVSGSPQSVALSGTGMAAKTK
jgi:hypothetical protein